MTESRSVVGDGMGRGKEPSTIVEMFSILIVVGLTQEHIPSKFKLYNAHLKQVCFIVCKLSLSR